MSAKLSKYTDNLLFMGIVLPLFLYDLISIWIIMARGSLFSNLELCCVRLIIVVLSMLSISVWLTVRLRSGNLFRSILFCAGCFAVFCFFSVFYILLSVLLGVLVIPASVVLLYIVCILFCIVFEKVFRCKVSEKFLFALELTGIILLSLISFYLCNKVFSFYSIYLRLTAEALAALGIFKLAGRLFGSIVIDEDSSDAVNLRSQVVGSLIVVTLFMLAFIIVNIRFITEDSEKTAFESVYNACSDCVNDRDFESALRYSRLLTARKNAVDSLTGENDYNISSIYGSYPDDYVIGGLYLTEMGSLSTLEDKIFKQELSGKEWKSILLKWYSTLDNLEDHQKDLRKNILVEMLLDRQYTYSNVIMFDDVKSLSGYDEEYTDQNIIDTVSMVLGAVVEYERTGYISRGTALNALDLAEKYPDALNTQYDSIVISLNYRHDNAEHYDRIADSVRRLDQCYDKDDYYKYYNLGMFMELCNHYDDAVDYYKTAYGYDKTFDVILSCARVYEKLDDHENCYKMSDELLLRQPDCMEALYLKALSCLKSGNIDEMIDAAGKISESVADNEKYLFSLAHYISVSDSGQYTDYTYRVYDKLTEEQIEAMNRYPVLWNYASAVYYTFSASNSEMALEYADNILDTDDNLSEVKYLKGVIYQNMNDYESALKCYKEAEDHGLNTKALYYSMANAYDALEMYEESYKYSMLIFMKYPQKSDLLNHDEDIYGIAFHNKTLLDALSEEFDLEAQR